MLARSSICGCRHAATTTASTCRREEGGECECTMPCQILGMLEVNVNEPSHGVPTAVAALITPPHPPTPTSSPRPSSHMLASPTRQIYRKQADRTARGLSPSPDVHLPQVFFVGGLPNQPVRVALHRQRQAGLGAHAQQRARQPACVWAVCVCDCTQRVLERV